MMMMVMMMRYVIPKEGRGFHMSEDVGERM